MMNYDPRVLDEARRAQSIQTTNGLRGVIVQVRPFPPPIGGLGDRIRELESELATAREFIATQGVRMQQWQAENARLRAAYADLEAKYAAPAPALAKPVEAPPLLHALTHARQTIGLLTEKP